MRSEPLRKALPLYSELPRTPLETSETRVTDPACTRCDLHKGAKRAPCIGPMAYAPKVPMCTRTLLVVGDKPGRAEDMAGTPFAGAAAHLLRRTVTGHWDGPVVYDLALRCPPGQGEKIKPKQVDACRPFLAQTFREAIPERIIALGNMAAMAVTGRTSSPMNCRRGYTVLPPRRGVHGLIPVFFVLAPEDAIRNRFVRAWFEADMEWALTTNPEPADWGAELHLVMNEEDARAAIAWVRRAEWTSFDVESAGLLYDPSFRLLSVSLTAKGDRDAYVWTDEALRDKAVFGLLVDYLCDPSAKKIGQNVKFDMSAVYTVTGRMPQGITLDVRLIRKLLEPEADAALDRTSLLVGMGGMKEEADEVRAKGKKEVSRLLGAEARAFKKGKPVVYGLGRELGVDAGIEALMRNPDVAPDAWSYALLPKPLLYTYNARDSVCTTALGEKLEAEIAVRPPLLRVWNKVVAPASVAIAQVEAWGVLVDRSGIEAFDDYMGVRERDMREQLRAFADINWGSSDQVAEFFFRKLGLRSAKKTDGGKDSTDEEALGLIRAQHPAVDMLLELRGVSKLRGTYAGGMLAHIRSDRRIHTHLLLDGTRTGRLASQDPNLQNQPRPDTPEAKMVRDNFIADIGNVLVQLDFSQIELRKAADLSGDELMADIFRSGIDYHYRTAQLIAKQAWGLDPDSIEKKGPHRTAAKSINFALLYGSGDEAIAASIGSTKAQAAAVRLAILGKFAKLDRWSKERLHEGRRTGMVHTEWDGEEARWRPLWRIADPDDYVRSVAEHACVNSPVQGSAGDLCTAAFAQSVDYIVEERVPAKLVLPVHDSLMFEVKREAAHDLAGRVKEIMESQPCGNVPLVVDVEWGPAWGSLSKMEL